MLRLLARRFGDLPADVRVRAHALTDAELDRAAELAATTPSVRAWLEALAR